MARKRLKPKPKHEKKSWQKRNEARKVKQDVHAATAATIAIVKAHLPVQDPAYPFGIANPGIDIEPIKETT